MDAIESDELRAYFVWLPVLPGDSEKHAQALAKASTEARASHYWNPSLSVARAYGPVLDMPAKWSAVDDGLAAWDVVMLFAKGQRWDKSVPEPAVGMAMFPADLPTKDMQAFSAEGFAAAARRAIATP